MTNDADVVTRVEDVLGELEAIDEEISRSTTCDALATSVSQSIGRLRTGIKAARHQQDESEVQSDAN